MCKSFKDLHMKEQRLPTEYISAQRAKESLLCLIFLLAASFVFAQEWCDTKSTSESINRLRSHQVSFMNKVPEKMQRFVPVHFHFVARDDGSGRRDLSKSMALLCKLNHNFEKYGFVFYIDTMTMINNSDIYNGRSDVQIRNELSRDAMNVFLMQGVSGGAAGYYETVDDYLVLRSWIGNQDYDDGYTFEHEVGHFFSTYTNHHQLGCRSGIC